MTTWKHAALSCATLFACAPGVSLGTTAPVESAARNGAAVRALAAWNEMALRTTAAAAASPPRETRTLAMASAAAFDAVNSIARRYEPYAVRVVAGPDASMESAVGGATHRYRNAAEIADEVVNARVWAGVHWRTSCTTGRELGRRVGALVLARAPKRID